MVLPIITGSPGVYVREEDISQQDIPFTTSIGCLAFASKKGTLDAKLVTSATGFNKEYGPSDISWGYGHISANAFFSTQNNNNTSPPALWCKRVVNTDARHAGATVLNVGSGAVGDTANEILSFINPFPVGTLNGYAGGGRQIFIIQFSQALSGSDSISGSVTPSGDDPVAFGPIAYATSHAATMAAIVAAINTALDDVPPATNAAGGFAEILLGDPTRNMIIVYGPEGTTIEFAADLTGGGGGSRLVLGAGGPSLSVTTAEASTLFEVYAENPGSWANDLGISITDIDNGVKQRVQLTFSDALVASNIVHLALLVNSDIINVANTTYATSNDATLTALATAIETAIPNSTATVVIPAGSGGSSARQINIIAPTAGVGVLGLYAASVTAGTSQASISFRETYAGSASAGTFTLNVWKRGNIKTPAESFICSLGEQLDGLGRQLFAEQKINLAAGKSQNIRVSVNTAAIATGSGLDSAYASYYNTITWLDGGDDGSLPSNSQLVVGWDTFSDAETYRVNLLINAGQTELVVQQKIAQVAENRGDCFAILDMPSDAQEVNAALSYRTTEMNIDSSYAAVYSPDLQVVDLTSDKKIYVPPSGYVASRYVYTDNNFATFWAPAGHDRGRLPGVIGLREIYKKPDRDVLDPVQINCIRLALDGSGYLIWGDNTLQVTKSLRSAINVRRLMLYIETTIAASLERNVFDNNSAQLAFLIQQRIKKFLDVVQANGGIKRYLVVCNSSNNPAYFADAGQLNVSVYIVPIRAAKTILLDAVITPSDINFNEIVINGQV